MTQRVTLRSDFSKKRLLVAAAEMAVVAATVFGQTTKTPAVAGPRGSAILQAQVFPQTSAEPPQSKLGVSPRDFARPSVMPDLKKAVALLYNEEHLAAADLDYEFKHCEFTRLTLGALGAAVLVAWNPLRTPNASMLNIYIFRRGSYYRLVESIGFGPEILPEPRPIPDLIFGWASGVCHAKYSRYRYRSGRYAIDACNEETEAKDGDCAINACQNGLPTFPNPFPSP